MTWPAPPEHRASSTVDFTVVTPAYNSAATIERTLASVRSQRGVTVQHIVVDGASEDGTAALVGSHPHRPDVLVSEPDRGLYDAINKGLERARGRYVAILNADDRYAGPDVLATYLEAFGRLGVEALYADVVFVRTDEQGRERQVRRYRSSRFSPSRMAWGWMPAHPTLVASAGLVGRVGAYRTDYRIAADYEWCIRAFVTASCSHAYLPMEAVLMAMGGVSTSGWRATIDLNREVLRACRDNGIDTNVVKLLSKYPAKLIDLVRARVGT